MKIENYTKTKDKEYVFNVNIEFNTKIDLTPRILQISEAFGLGVDGEKKFVIYDDFHFGFDTGDIVYITGDSGGGKSILMEHIYDRLDDKKCLFLEDINPDMDETIVEGLGENLDQAIYYLSKMGLNDAFIFLRKYKHLSDGQKYRYRLAKAIARQPDFLFIDEFCANLDRTTAKVISYNLQKVCRKNNLTLFTATTHRDLKEDLNPSVYVEKRFMDEVILEYPEYEKRKISFYDDIETSEATIDDYKKLAKYHYKSTGTNFPYTKIYKLTYGRELVGVVVYSPPFLQTKGRTIEFDKKYSLMTKEVVAKINELFIRLSRIVLSPKYRACGLSLKLMKDTFPLTGKKYVEMVNVMGKYNPFGKRAGMKEIEITEETDSAALKLDVWLEDQGCKMEEIHNPKYFEKWVDDLDDEQKEQLVRLTGKVLHHPKIGLSGKDGKRAEVVSQEKRYKKATFKEVRDEILSYLPKLYSGTTLYYIWENENIEESKKLEDYF